MDSLMVGYIGIAILFILLFSGIHIGAVMGLVGFLGLVVLSGWDSALGTLKTVPFTTFSSYDYTVIPLFILMGELSYHGNITGSLYNAAHMVFGSLRGGVAMATVGACAAFAAISGSSLATAATMTSIALPEMKSRNYDMGLATGSLAAGGTIGPIIPPSVFLIVYGMIAQQSIGKLFLAGFIPGIIQAILFIMIIGIMCWIKPKLGPAAPKSSLLEKIKAFKGIWIVLLLFILVVGGIYLGWFSPTAGAGIGAFGAFAFSVANRTLNLKNFKNSLLETTRTTGMIFFILLGSMILGYFFAVTRLPNELSSIITSLSISPYIIWLFVVIMYLILGCLMDALPMILLTVPIIYPAMCGPGGLGFDPIWFGVMVVIIANMGLITPPVGMNVFVIKGMAPDIPTYTIFKGIMPFLITIFIEIVLFTAIPSLVIWLPQNM